MRAFEPRTALGWCLLLLACNPETDLDKARTAATGADAGGGNLPGPSTSAQSGRLVDPPPGSLDIATNLAGVVLGFPEAVLAANPEAGAILQPSSAANPVLLRQVAEVPCGTKCYAFALTAELAPAMAYTLKIPGQALQFLDGKPVPPGDAGGFATGAAPDLFAPRVQAFTLDIAEGCASIHLAADEQVGARVLVTSSGVETALTSLLVGSVVDFAQRLPDLPADPRAQAVAYIADRSGNQGVSSPLAFALPAPAPPVVITEVLANPAGSETTQEFVELYNRGSAPVALTGWLIEDKTGKDVLPEAVLVPGAYALIVADSYNPADGKDPAPADGTLLLHVPGRLGSDGLSNSGEVVRLLDTSGQVVSQYGGWVDAGATSWSGRSTKRVSFEACDAPDAWSKTPSAPTPGW